MAFAQGSQIALPLVNISGLPINGMEVAQNVAEVLAYDPSIRYIGLSVFCIDEAQRYTFKKGVTDADFVPDSGDGILIVDNYKVIPTSTVEKIVYCKNDYKDTTVTPNVTYDSGFYRYDLTLSKWILINSDEKRYPEWESNYDYAVDDLVSYNNEYYRCINAHTSSTDFTTDSDNWIDVLEIYYSLTKAKFDAMVASGLITDKTKHLYIITDQDSDDSTGIDIYDDYSLFPNPVEKESIVYAKNDYVDITVTPNITYKKGFYLGDDVANTYTLISSEPEEEYKEWQANYSYVVGDKVTDNGLQYDCIEDHTSQTLLTDDEDKWILSFDRYYAITKSQKEYMVNNGLLTDTTKSLYIVIDEDADNAKGIEIVDDYSLLPQTLTENAIYYCINKYTDINVTPNVDYESGFYLYNVTTGLWTLISSGKVEEYESWESNKAYTVNQKVKYNNEIFKCIKDHTSSSDFTTDEDNWILTFNEYYALKESQYNQMLSDGLITNDTKSLYIVVDKDTDLSSGIKIYDNYSLFEHKLTEEVIVYAKNDYIDSGTTYTSGFYLYNITNDTYTLISSGNNNKERYPLWESGKNYVVDNLVTYNNGYYRCITDHTSSTNFITDEINWISVLEVYYTIKQVQYDDMVSRGLITDETKHLYVIIDATDNNTLGSGVLTKDLTTSVAVGNIPINTTFKKGTLIEDILTALFS